MEPQRSSEACSVPTETDRLIRGKANATHFPSPPFAGFSGHARHLCVPGGQHASEFQPLPMHPSIQLVRRLAMQIVMMDPATGGAGSDRAVAVIYHASWESRRASAVWLALRKESRQTAQAIWIGTHMCMQMGSRHQLNPLHFFGSIGGIGTARDPIWRKAAIAWTAHLQLQLSVRGITRPHSEPAGPANQNGKPLPATRIY